MLMALAVPVVLAQALLVANLSGQLLRGALRGDVHSGATCGDTHVQWSGAGQWLEGMRYGFLKKTRRHMGRKSRDLGGKRCRLFAALACSVGDKVAGRCDGGGGSAGRIKRHVYRQGGVMIFFRFCCIPFGPCGLFRLACSCKRHARRLLLMETAARMALQFVCSRDFMPRALRIRKGRAGAVSAP